MAASTHCEQQGSGTDNAIITMDQLVAELDRQRSSLREDMSTLIKSSIQPVQSSVDSLCVQVNAFQTRLDHTEAVVGENLERLATTEATIKSLQSQNAEFLERLDDLENRSRRANLRIVNIPEGSENGRDTVEFISELLTESMGVDVFPKPPKLERAHRTLGPKPGQGGAARSRAFVVCFHHFQEKEQALRWARQNELKCHGSVLRLYPDLSTALAKKRASFNNIKQALYQKKVQFRLLHPARLCVTLDNETHVFLTPEEAKSWFEKHIQAE